MAVVHQASGAERSPDRSEQERSERANQSFWTAAGTLYKWRRFIMVVTALAAVASVVIALLLPVWYQATAKVLLPERSRSSAFSTMLGDIGGAAASLLGVSGGDYVRYMAILDRRQTQEDVVRVFNLEDVYETTESETSLYDAWLMFRENLNVTIDAELDYLAVNVLDKDPQRAADIANHLVDELNRVNAEMVSSNASKYRRFVEERYRAAETERDSTLAAMQRFQAKHGVLELDTQMEAFLTMVANWRSEATLAEIEYEALRRSVGEKNAAVVSARNRVLAARQKERDVQSGRDGMLPVSFEDLPEVTSEYVSLKQDILVNAEILKFARPLLEQAIFDEEMKSPAVQELERAVPPIEKAKPVRSLVCIGITLTAFLLACLFALVYDWWRREGDGLVARLETAGS